MKKKTQQLSLFGADSPNWRQIARTMRDDTIEGGFKYIKSRQNVTPKPDKSVFYADNYALHDDMKAALNGIYHDEREHKGVITNTFILVSSKKLYDENSKGKTIATHKFTEHDIRLSMRFKREKGDAIVASMFPVWRAVLMSKDNDTQRVDINFDTFADILAGIEDREKEIWKNDKNEGKKFKFATYKKNADVYVRMPDGQIATYDLTLLQQYATAAKFIGATALEYTPKAKGLTRIGAIGDDGEIVLMNKTAVKSGSGMINAYGAEKDTPHCAGVIDLYGDIELYQGKSSQPSNSPAEEKDKPAGKPKFEKGNYARFNDNHLIVEILGVDRYENGEFVYSVKGGGYDKITDVKESSLIDVETTDNYEEANSKLAYALRAHDNRTGSDTYSYYDTKEEAMKHESWDDNRVIHSFFYAGEVTLYECLDSRAGHCWQEKGAIEWRRKDHIIKTDVKLVKKIPGNQQVTPEDDKVKRIRIAKAKAKAALALLELVQMDGANEEDRYEHIVDYVRKNYSGNHPEDIEEYVGNNWDWLKDKTEDYCLESFEQWLLDDDVLFLQDRFPGYESDIEEFLNDGWDSSKRRYDNLKAFKEWLDEKTGNAENGDLFRSEWAYKGEKGKLIPLYSVVNIQGNDEEFAYIWLRDFLAEDGYTIERIWVNEAEKCYEYMAK